MDTDVDCKGIYNFVGDEHNLLLPFSKTYSEEFENKLSLQYYENSHAISTTLFSMLLYPHAWSSLQSKAN
jgi:hypothetical protein